MEVVGRSQDWDHEVFLEVGDGDPDEDGGHPQGVPDGRGDLIQGAGRGTQRDGRGQVRGGCPVDQRWGHQGWCSGGDREDQEGKCGTALTVVTNKKKQTTCRFFRTSKEGFCDTHSVVRALSVTQKVLSG